MSWLSRLLGTLGSGPGPMGPKPGGFPGMQPPGLNVSPVNDPLSRNGNGGWMSPGGGGWQTWAPIALSAVGAGLTAYGDYADRRQHRREFEDEKARRDEETQRSHNLDPIRQMILQRFLGTTGGAPTGPAPQAPPPEVARPPVAASPTGVYADAVQQEEADRQRRLLAARLGLGGYA
jgi:hypothetical protein